MAAAAPRIAELSAERVREELERISRRRRRGRRLRLARDVGALAVALPEWAPCIGLDQHSATQAYALDEHILHVLEAAVHDGARRERGSRRSGTTSASRTPRALASTPRRACASRARCAA